MGERSHADHFLAGQRLGKSPASASASAKLAQVGSMWLVPVALRALVELGVHRILAKAGHAAFLSPREIAAEIPESTPFTVATVARFLRLLTAYGVFEEAVEEGGVERKFALNEVSALLLHDEEGVSLEDMILFQTSNINLTCGQYLSETALDGAPPFKKAHGTDTWTYSSQNPKFDIVFNKMMVGMSKLMVQDFLQSYAGFDDFQGTLVDVAGGYGQITKMVVEKHPQIKGINFDQPHVVATAPSYPGIEHVGGDMFQSIPQGDAVILKWILHDWSDEDCLIILRNIRKALPAHGKLLIVEAILPARTDKTEETQTQLHVDLFMLTVNVNGRERTEAEYRKMLSDVGFSRLNFIQTGQCLCSVIEAWL